MSMARSRVAAALLLCRVGAQGHDIDVVEQLKSSFALEMKGMAQSLSTPIAASASCTVSGGEACPLAAMSRDESTMVYPGGNTRCIYSTSTPYAFQVVPGDSDKMLVFFQGGGACWDQPSTDAKSCTSDAVPQDLVGLFDRTNPSNPYQAYTIVHVLYCSGDLHAGNVTRPYPDDAGVPVEQRGYANSRAAIDWATANMAPRLADLVLSGCSAGSLGVQVWAAELLGELSYDRASVVADSYAGVFPPGTMGPLTKSYGFCDVGVLEGDLLASCQNETLEVQTIFTDAMRTFPAVAFANVNSKSDDVQMAYYTSVAISFGVKPSAITPSQYFGDLNVIFELYNTFANYVSFVVTSSQHCYFPYALTFTATTASPQGGPGVDGGPAASLSSWVANFPLGASLGAEGPTATSSTSSVVASGHRAGGASVGTECDGEVLASADWHGDAYCDAAQQGKTIAASSQRA